ncbi:MAG: response regulator [Anaerolineae bacterium]
MQRTFREPDMSKGKILVVEDDVALLEGIRDILELDGYTVLAVSSGVEGVEYLRKEAEPPDLIVSDIMMPKMSGYEFFEIVRSEADWVTIPFIFLTAKGEKADVRLGMGMGVDYYVTKPFDSEDLLVAVESRLRRAKQIGYHADTQVAELKRNILTILNHEFRTPLTYVVAYADMLSRDAEELDPKDFASFLRGIQTGSDRLRKLIENFIFLVELETGEAAATFNWRKRRFNDFHTLLESVIEQAQADAEDHSVSFVIDAPDDLPVVEGDRDYLRGALGRLVDNAIKFSKPEGGDVLLKVTAGDGEVIVSVSDKGRGIPEKEIGRIFDAFYQVDRERYEDQGAGSGLAIVRGIAQLHGGRLWVESEFGKGSTFYFAIPVAEEEQ